MNSEQLSKAITLIQDNKNKSKDFNLIKIKKGNVSFV